MWQLRQPFQKTSFSPLSTAAFCSLCPARYSGEGRSPVCPLRKVSRANDSSSEKSNCGIFVSTRS